MLYRVVVILCTLAAIVSATMRSRPLEEKPEKFNDIPGCYIGDLDQVVPLGENASSPNCVIYICEEDWYNVYTCNIETAGPRCKFITLPDQSKPYPECCPLFVC